MVTALLPVWSLALAEKEGKMSDALTVIHSGNILKLIKSMTEPIYAPWRSSNAYRS
jgi:hypothetical protein